MTLLPGKQTIFVIVISDQILLEDLVRSYETLIYADDTQVYLVSDPCSGQL